MAFADTLRRFEKWEWFRTLLAPARRAWRYWFALGMSRRGSQEMRDRADLVLQCPDLARLRPAPDAGQIKGKTQVMHNGVLVEKGCYYHPGSVDLFKRTRGIHEPQEEIAFAEILPYIPSGATMLELGSYWAFYSIWFAKTIPGARCHLVEPDVKHLDLGPRNFALNGLKPASASRRFIADQPGQTPDGIPIASVDQLAAELGIERLHLLHSDIQSFERAMLDGARRMIDEGRIDFIFVSSHGDDLHRACREFLTGHGFDIIMDVPQAGAYSIDGILVARRRGVKGPEAIKVALRPAGAAA